VNLDFKNIKQVYLLGIGGIGMSALARYFHKMGKSVSGYDKTPTPLTDELLAEGIEIHFYDNIRLIPANIKQLPYALDSILVIYTPAIPKDHTEFIYFKENGFTLMKRAEVLGLITENSNTLAVAGTHGKTTTSSLIAHILKTANLDPSAFLGGITQNYNTNLLVGSDVSQSSLVVVEADEYDRSFLTLHPETGIITSVDADHLDIYGDEKYMQESYSMFANQVKSKLILKMSIVSKIKTNKPVITYSVSDDDADYFAQHIRIENGMYHFEIVTPTNIYTNMTVGLPGLHNVENAVAAVAATCEMKVSEKFIREALLTFRGVKRRFDYQIKTDNLVYIDDYAHHPKELEAIIKSAKEMYPNKKITGVFQPHLFTRTRDFADDFARSLDLLDECILMEIYPARELPIEGVTSQMLLNRMKSSHKSICQKDVLVETVAERKLEVLLTLGAGDIDTFVEPIRIALLKNSSNRSNG
jgi:UDP-N-acetylmuramate--alanine ligase